MWQTYSILSKTRKPRISPDEFLDYYNIDKSEIQEYELIDFLDFFEVSRDDLIMETKEEVLLMLQGFRLDREAESSTYEDLSKLTAENIQKVKFNGMYRNEAISGEIDFMNRLLRWNNNSSSFWDVDKLVLWQVLKDMDSVRNAATDAGLMEDSGIEFVLLDKKGEKRLVRRADRYVGMFLRIVRVIMERAESS